MSFWRVSSYQTSDGGGQSVDLLDQAWFDCTQQPGLEEGEKQRFTHESPGISLYITPSSDIKKKKCYDVKGLLA